MHSRISSAWVLIALFGGGTSALAGFLPADFLAADGPVIRSAAGHGPVVTLRGTNLGGWLVQEGWMSPNGEGTVARQAWRSQDEGRAAESVRVLEWEKPTTFDGIAIRLQRQSGRRAPEFWCEMAADGTTWHRLQSRSSVGADHEFLLTLDRTYTARQLRVGVRAAGSTITEVGLLENDDYAVRQTLAHRFGAAAAGKLIAGYQRAWLTTADLDRLSSWGLNVLRVPMNWLDFVDLAGNWQPGAWERLDWIIRECDARKIYVVLDLHAVPGGASPWASSGHAGDDGTGQNPNGFWTEPRCQELTAEIWTRIAGRYHGNPAVAGYDLVNEPVSRFDDRPRPGEQYSEATLQKAAMFDRLYRAVRAVDAKHLIFIAAYTVADPGNGAYVGTPSGFKGITAPSYYGWQNVVYETHHYDMVYSGDRAAQAKLVADSLADIAQHRQAWKVPIYAGEFSLYRFYDVWSEWLSGLNALNVSWTSWTYKIRGTASEPAGANWGLFNSNDSRVPDINHDTADEIETKWSRFGTERFKPNSPLIEVISRYARRGPALH